MVLMVVGGGAYYAWKKLSGADGSMWSERTSDAPSGVPAGAPKAAA